MLEKKIGLRIRQIRLSCGFSQIELAERIGLSFQQIQKYEKGLTRISVARLHQISEALGVSISAFFEEGERDLQISDSLSGYPPAGDSFETCKPLTKEELTLLKLFRKTKNRKVREGIIKQLRGIVELEKQKSA